MGRAGRQAGFRGSHEIITHFGFIPHWVLASNSHISQPEGRARYRNRGNRRGKQGIRQVTKSVFSEEYYRFRRLLIEARQAAQLTQAQLSAKLSRPQSYVSKYERGERRLDLIEFLEVAQALELDPIRFIEKLLREKEGE